MIVIDEEIVRMKRRTISVVDAGMVLVLVLVPVPELASDEIISGFLSIHFREESLLVEQHISEIFR